MTSMEVIVKDTASLDSILLCEGYWGSGGGRVEVQNRTQNRTRPPDPPV